MICCLNPDCHNPPNSYRTMFCSNCGTGLVVLRNRYRPIKSLGGGGFGQTYLAEDIDKLNEHCVIKQFAPQVQGTGALQKATELFEQEAKRLQQLGNHRQIPTLLAYFNEDNRLYLVQEFIDGQNLLAELQQQGIFNEQKVRELLLDLLDILKTVHQQKVIHRDIKPENIIRPGDGKLVLIDFGVSKQLTATVMTQPGTAIGSFGYAPLEQMQGGEAYPASDLYNVGATCFHLLTGIHPWELWKRQGYGWVASWRQYLQKPVSQDLGRMLDRLLQEEYQQRYQSAAEVLQDLNPPPPSVTPTQLVIAAASSMTVILPSKKIPATIPPTVKRLLWGFCVTGIVGYGIIMQASIIGFLFFPVIRDSPQLIATITLVKTLEAYSQPVNSVAISPDGKTLASGSDDSKLWNLATGEQIRTLTGGYGWVHSVAISPDGKTIVISSGDIYNTIDLWNLATGEQIRTFKEDSALVNSVAISPDGKTLASGSDDKTIKLWNLATGEEIRTLTGHSDLVYSVAFSPDGKTLASGSWDKTIKLWNLATGEEIRTLTGHSDWVNSVAISPDGKTLASGSRDQTIKLWNLATGEQIRTLTGHSDWVNSVAISPDGKTLASGSRDQT
ncbi:MAG: serine/threonine-protein kinase, partial [Nostoc sp.]|uniref:serine/threonine-protein kinase n=1 Tax=Nostoc sp. TaxID=1180 RepID=UPI002FFC0771